MIGATSALLGYKTETDRLCNSLEESNKKTDEYLSSIEQGREIIQEELNSQLAQIEYTQRLANELDVLVDSNGKVKDGYEDRVAFILGQLSNATGEEWRLINGTIDKYQELKGKINEVLVAKRAEVVSNATQKALEEAIGRQVQLQQDKINKQKELNDATKLYNEKLEMIEIMYGSVEEARKKSLKGDFFAIYDIQKLEELENKMNEAQNRYNKITANIEADNNLIISSEELKMATITGNTDEINKKIQELTSTYETETGRQTASLEAQVAKEIDEANQRKKLYEENGKEINEIIKAQLETQLRNVAENLVKQTNKVEELTPDQKEAWKRLGEGNYEIYKEYLEKTDPKTREEIQNITGVIVEKTPEVEKATQELANTIIDNLDNSEKIRKEAVKSVREYILGLSEPEQRKLLKDCGIENVDKVIEGLKEGDLSEDVGVNILKGLNRGLKNDSWQGRTLSTAFTFATNVLKKFKNTFGIKSPSRETKQFGIYLLEGLGLGIKKEESSVLKTVGNFSNKVLDSFGLVTNGISQGITINPNDFKIDTNQFIDYGQISGAVSTQSNVNVSSDIEGRIEKAIYKGLSNATIPIEIEATTDEGVIFKKVQVKAREFKIQTGEPAFDY